MKINPFNFFVASLAVFSNAKSSQSTTKLHLFKQGPLSLFRNNTTLQSLPPVPPPTNANNIESLIPYGANF